jgi:gluconolactonase
MKILLPLVALSAFAFGVDAPEFTGSIERFDSAFDKLIARDAKIEKLASGFTWSEGPENTAYRWKEGDTKAEVFLKPSGMTGTPTNAKEQGSNGLARDAKGQLILCQHGDRRVARMIAPGKFETLADKFEGKRFSSPNDLAIRKNGDIYFTDPPYGLTGLNDSPLKEIPFNGVYRVTPDGKVTLLTKALTFPNGIAFSPDEKILYVAISDPKFTRIAAFDVKDDGTIANERTFFDAEKEKRPGLKGACDGLKIDRDGNVWTTAPGGVFVLSREGKPLGRINTGQPTANCAWGDDGSTFYITANMFLLCVKTLTKGAGW